MLATVMSVSSSGAPDVELAPVEDAGADVDVEPVGPVVDPCVPARPGLHASVAADSRIGPMGLT